MADIDIMLPYYGDVDLMKAAVRSVLAQTYSNWRLVVIDDGYPSDEPRRWFGNMSDPRVTYLRNESNLGANGNYRRAVDLVEACRFVMMGADDIMERNFLAVVMRSFRQFPDVDVVQVGVRTIDESGRPSNCLADKVKRLYAPRARNAVTLSGEAMATSLIRANWAYFPALAWRSETVKRLGLRHGFDVVQDLALLLDVAAENGSIVVEPERAFRYRRHSESDSSVRAFDGSRFEEERRFFIWQASRFREIGWTRTSRVSHMRLTSRLHALSVMARALARGRFGSVARLWRYVLT